MDVPDRAAPPTPRARAAARAKGAARSAPRVESRPGRARETAARAPRAGASASAQSVLALAVRRLAEETGAARCAAWSCRPDGAPFVAAARFADGRALAPRPAELAALATLRRAARLGARSPAALHALARRHGFAAAAPVERAAEGPATAYLLIGPDASPRAVAALEAASRRIAPRLAVAEASARLDTLDAGLRRLDRLAALGDLVAEIVHEVRNPLVSVKTFLQLLPERLDDPEFRTDFLGIVTDELRRIERLLDVVLGHARPRGAGARDASAELAPAIESVARLVAHRALERGVRFETRIAPDLPAAALPEDALRQIALNLVLNAIDATPAEGAVEVAAEAAGEGVALVVDDQGPGVPPALRERIFEPFFSTRRERPGGLGLAITRRLAEEAGGRVEVSARRGGGTRFRVTLPRAQS